MRKKVWAASLLALSLSFTSACGLLDKLENKRQQNMPNIETATGAVPESVSKYVAPLTGLPVESENKDRVVMVMVNNHSKARPQSGLDQADMVYEMLEEGLITRFMAFYQSKSPKVVGPVRSIRPYNIEIGQGFDAIMSHAGGSVAALSMLRSGDYADMDEIYTYPKAYWRDKSRKAPHNLYTNIEKLRKGAEEKGYNLGGDIPVFLFKKEDESVEGEPGTKISIRYSKRNTAGYEYDPATKQYKRFTAGKPHLDKETGKQLLVTNVLVIAAHHRVLDGEGRLEIDTEGPGEGYLFQRGKALKITWERKDGAIRAYQNGVEVPLYPGTTWVNVVPTTPSFSEHMTFE
ncbi:DUF3048 domain-containing protein [Aneurinibacillus thermoaerophilus]|uniref:DUF3048 domain-containing protein n=1 Tax=Aneurinibacillus thermoaerophilus TaxID=143495 RepID=A0ABX8YBY1_ANETH|nr:DUF3048 domain-containing protein [Aneurinibacillus thermoaerophilus]QYY43208.1 DUF3048 domain-containing protein [Aneurinibacillus thermoaerophilus]